MLCNRDVVGRRFCVLSVRTPAAGAIRTLVPRNVRLVDTMRRVELDNESPCGDILTFVQFLDKRWTLCVVMVPLEQVHFIMIVQGSPKKRLSLIHI